MNKKTNKKNKGSYILYIVGIAFIIVMIAMKATDPHYENEEQFQKKIAKEIIRFHVIANSDSETDQKLKLKVKEKVVTKLQKDLKDAKDIQQAKEIILSQLKQIETIANHEMRENGFTYTAHASLGKSTFPVKMYGDMVFPSGDYQALRVELGKSKGKNWWCVMFPTLCFVNGTYSVVPDESKEKLEEVLTEEDYKALLVDNQEQVTIRFRILDWWNELIQ